MCHALAEVRCARFRAPPPRAPARLARGCFAQGNPRSVSARNLLFRLALHPCAALSLARGEHQFVVELGGARSELGAIWRRHMGKHFPAMSMIFVSDLLDHPGKIELEATAAIPPD